MRTRVLSDREGAIRLGLPVRSREGHGLHPRDAADIRFAQSGEGCAGEDFPREFGGDYWDEICKIVAWTSIRWSGLSPTRCEDARSTPLLQVIGKELAPAGSGAY